MDTKYNNTENARVLCNAIRLLAKNEDALNNFECYLRCHFHSWMEWLKSDPTNLASEFDGFAHMYDEVTE